MSASMAALSGFAASSVAYGAPLVSRLWVDLLGVFPLVVLTRVYVVALRECFEFSSLPGPSAGHAARVPGGWIPASRRRPPTAASRLGARFACCVPLAPVKLGPCSTFSAVVASATPTSFRPPMLLNSSDPPPPRAGEPIPAPTASVCQPATTPNPPAPPIPAGWSWSQSRYPGGQIHWAQIPALELRIPPAPAPAPRARRQYGTPFRPHSARHRVVPRPRLGMD